MAYPHELFRPRLEAEGRFGGSSAESSETKTPGGMLVLTLDDVLARVPTRALKPGLHDPSRRLHFAMDELLEGISRGRATIMLSKLAERYPETFEAPAPGTEDAPIYLPLQKLMQQIGRTTRVAPEKPETPAVVEPPPVARTPAPSPTPAASEPEPVASPVARLLRRLKVMQEPVENAPVVTLPAEFVVEPPAKSESVKAEKAKAEAAKQEKARDEAAKAEAAKLERAKAEAAKVEAARVEAARLEAAKAEARVEAAQLEAAKAEAVRVAAAKAEAARLEAARLEAAKAEAARLEAARLEAANAEAARIESARVAAAKAEAARIEAAKVAAAKAEAARLEAARVEAARREAEKIEAARREAAKAEAARLEAAKLEAARLEAERVDAARLEAEKAEAARIEAAARAEAARVEAAQAEAARIEAARAEAERLEAEKAEAARLEAARLEAAQAESARAEAGRAEAARLEAAKKEELPPLTPPPLPIAPPPEAKFHAPEPASAPAPEMPHSPILENPPAHLESNVRFPAGRPIVRPPSLQGPAGLVSHDNSAPAPAMPGFVFAPRQKGQHSDFGQPTYPLEADLPEVLIPPLFPVHPGPLEDDEPAAPEPPTLEAVTEAKEEERETEPASFFEHPKAFEETGPVREDVDDEEAQERRIRPTSVDTGDLPRPEDLLGGHFSLARIDQEPLQAIFMTEEFLDLPRVSQLSCGFPGITGCMIVAGDALAQGGERPAGLDAEALCKLTKQLSAVALAFPEELPAVQTYTLHVGNRALSIFARPNVSLCLVHSHRGFLPGVRERLAAVADTLSRGLSEEAAGE